MEAILTALGEQHAELEALLDPLEDVGWQRPTRCDGWNVADVVLHLSQTDDFALASLRSDAAEGPRALTGNVDEAAATLVDSERGLPTEEIAARWRTTAAALRAELATSNAGPLSADGLEALVDELLALTRRELGGR